MAERVLGVDYVVLKGRGGREFQNGATCEGDNYMHLGFLGDLTACGKPFNEFLLTYADVDIDCPSCIKAIKEKTS